MKAMSLILLFVFLSSEAMAAQTLSSQELRHKDWQKYCVDYLPKKREIDCDVDYYIDDTSKIVCTVDLAIEDKESGQITDIILKERTRTKFGAGIFVPLTLGAAGLLIDAPHIMLTKRKAKKKMKRVLKYLKKKQCD